MKSLFRKFPSGSLSVLNLVAGAVCALIGHRELAPVFVATAAMFMGLETQVIAKKAAKETAVKAAQDAATTTAANLTRTTVGEVGQITEDATKVVDDAVDLVTGLLGVK